MYSDMAKELILTRRLKVQTIRAIRLEVTMVEMETKGIVNSYLPTMKSKIVVITVSITYFLKEAKITEATQEEEMLTATVGWPLSLITRENLTFPVEDIFSVQVIAVAVNNMPVHSNHFKAMEVEEMSMHTNRPITRAIGATWVVMVEEVVVSGEAVLRVVDMEEEVDTEKGVDMEEADLEEVVTVEADLEEVVMDTGTEDTSRQYM